MYLKIEHIPTSPNSKVIFSDLFSVELVKPPSVPPGRLPITGFLVRALFCYGALGGRKTGL